MSPSSVRRPVQIAIAASDEIGISIIALANDGSLWEMSWQDNGFGWRPWDRLLDLPPGPSDSPERTE